MSACADRLQLILKVLADAPLAAPAIREALLARVGADTPQERIIRRDLAVLHAAGAVRRHGYASDALWSLPESAPPGADDDLEAGF
jgi:repressor of nif and glnA expression